MIARAVPQQGLPSPEREGSEQLNQLVETLVRGAPEERSFALKELETRLEDVEAREALAVAHAATFKNRILGQASLELCLAAIEAAELSPNPEG